MDFQETSSAEVVVPSTDVKKFTPSGERLKSHGNLYHCQQLMLFLCKSVIGRKISFEVTCEIEEAGKFDDVVIFYKRDGKTLCRLIQIKHRENISKVLTSNDLTSNKDFKLKTYFDSYVKIRNDVKFDRKYGCEIDELVICTNVDLNDELKTYMEIVPDSIFNEDDLYRVRSSEIEFMKKLIVGNDVVREEFFCKLRFAVKRPDGEDLKDDIKREIVEHLEEEHPDDDHTSDRVETIYVTLLTKIIDFDTTRQVQIITDEGYLNWLHDAFSSRENRLSVYHGYNVCVLAARRLRFKRESLETLETFVTRNEVSLSKVIACADTIFTMQKLVQIFNLRNSRFRLIFDEQVAASMWNIKHDFLSTDRCEYLVVVCKSNEISKPVYKTVKNIHDKISKSSILNKRIVLITDSEVRSEIYSSICDGFVEFEDRIEWDDFDEETKGYVSKKQIVFQGQPVPFSVIDVSHVRGSIRDRVLFDIVLSDTFELGRPFHNSKISDMSYFVKRSVCLYDIGNTDEARFKMFKDETIPRKESSRSISIVDRRFKTRFLHKIELQTVSDIDAKLVLVIGEPGMGKSTLLSSLATRSIEQSPHVWVIKIDLNNHTRYFFDIKEKRRKFSDENDVIEFITHTQKFDGFEKELFESYFQIENKLVVLLDGFDEIAPHYKNIVVDLVNILKNADKITVWVTSRPQETAFLKEELDVLSYSLSEFTDEDQRQFFRKFWEQLVGIQNSRKARLETFIDRLLNAMSESLRTAHDLPTIIPLQCKMLADVYNDAFVEFYKNENDNAGIPDVIDILDLYDRFMRKKCEINIEEKRGNDTTRPGNITLVEKEIKRLTSRYKLLCLDVVFGKKDTKTLLTKKSKKEIARSLSDIENGVDKYGIVCSVENGIPIFVHRTFAEYFAAKYLRDFIDNAKDEKNERIAFVKSKLFEPEHTVVRRFFDRLTGTADVFKYALNGNTERLREELRNDREVICLTDKLGRNVLHFIAGYDYTEDICKCLVEFKVDKTRIDEFGLKPIEYASAFKIWGNINILIENESDETILRSIEDEENFMFTAAKKGWTRLIKYLVKIGKISVDTKNHIGVSMLHLAASQGHTETCRYLIEAGADVKRNFVVKYYAVHISHYDFYTNETPFHVALRKGFVEIVKMFIENDNDIIENICYKETLLHAAVKSGNVEMLRLLVEHGANVNDVNEYRETPLHIAQKDTDPAVIDCLSELGADIEARDDRGYNPLMKYVEVGNVSVARCLLAKGADIYYRTEKRGITVLHLAAYHGHLNILEMFVAHDPDIVSNIGSSEILLHDAVKSNKVEIVELLVRNGANVNGRNLKNETPLHIAGRDTSTEIVDTLLSHGADIEATDRYGNTPLIKYAEEVNSSVVRLLVAKGANVHYYFKNRKTLLHHATYTGDLNMVEILIARDPNFVRNIRSSETLLHDAMESNKVEIIELLVRNGADVNGRNLENETPLHIASRDTSAEIVDILSSHGADIEATDRYGNTPLIKYAEEDNSSVVRLLVTKGANIHHRSENGKTVLHHAVYAGSLNIVEILITHDPTIVNDIDLTETVLHEAIRSGKDIRFGKNIRSDKDIRSGIAVRTVQSLIKCGANVNGKNEKGETPLHVFTKNTDVRIIDIILKSGANIDETDNDGNMPLTKYIEADNFTVVRRLVALGADVRPPDLRTALHRAAAIGDLWTIKLFMRRDRTVVETIASANTLLHEAMKSNKANVIKLLIDSGADVNGRNKKGETPLHVARRYTSVAVIDLLLNHGANAEARANNGKTPLMKFVNCKNDTVVRHLQTIIDNSVKSISVNEEESTFERSEKRPQ